MARRLLSGVTVLSLEQATTLPFLTYRLACDGARVIRVEHAERPDPNRFVGHDVLAEPAMRSYFLPNNCGKEAITLNLDHPDGQALLRALIVKLPVDVFACNQRTRSYARLGIEPERLLAVKSDLIWLGITGFGPEHDEAAYAVPASYVLSEDLAQLVPVLHGPPPAGSVQVLRLSGNVSSGTTFSKRQISHLMGRPASREEDQTTVSHPAQT